MEEINISTDKTLWEVWQNNAKLHPERDAIIHWKSDGEPHRWSYKNLLERAEKYAVALKKSGIKKGDVCAIVIRHNEEFYPLYLSITCFGAVPAVLAYPNSRLHQDKFRQGIEGMAKRSGLDWIFTERDLEGTLTPLINNNGSSIKGMVFPLELDIETNHSAEILKEIENDRKEVLPEDPYLLQHSSGTTGLQKPVILSHKEVLVHVKNYSDSIKLTENDKIVSWLPLYHDMGLIAAFQLPLVFGIPTVQINTFEWIVAPSILLEAISKENGTLCWLPNFSYNLMADKIYDDELTDVKLDSLRMVINCSEPVRFESHAKFSQRFKDFGLKETALSTCYAMAETTFAVTQSEPGEVKTLTVDRSELAKNIVKIVADEFENKRICVSSGKTIAGCEVQILDENGEALNEDFVGEIKIKSESMFDGYRNYPEKTAEVLKDGWYYSGDIGFFHEGYLYVIGRKKDVIIVAGNNIYPEDVEDVISKMDGIIPGRVVAFGEDDEKLGSELISVIAETKIEDENEKKKLKLDIIRAGMQIDVSIRNVYLVPPRWLIKSSAGKPSRKANKERILVMKEESKLEVK